MPTFADDAIPYYVNLTEPTGLPPGVGVLNPYRQPAVQAIVRQFYTSFFNDNHPRVFVLGINPGRFGAGVTGISFTTPQNLQRYCGIPNALPPTPELSSRFIYQVVEAFGGAAEFYQQFFLTSLFPLALVKDGKNYNFYDDPATTRTLWPYIADSVRQQLSFGQAGQPADERKVPHRRVAHRRVAHRRVAVCLGKKNESFIQRLNQQEGFWDRIVTLDHPRYILQYRSRDLALYTERYIQTLADCLTD